VSPSAVRSQIVNAAIDREDHAGELEAVAALLDRDGYREQAGRARARAETLRATAVELRKIAGPSGLCVHGHGPSHCRSGRRSPSRRNLLPSSAPSVT
jgi:hypothetical protein